MSSFRVIPVLDLVAGRAVHARGGLRSGYRPVSGILGAGGDPFALAAVFRDRLGMREVYVADLDAVGGNTAAAGVLRGMAALGLSVLADVGLRDAVPVPGTLGAGVARLVAATETLSGLPALGDIVRAAGPDAVVFGLDLRDGTPLLAPCASWPDPRPEGLLDAALAVGIRSLLLLDLSRVGSGRGVGALGMVAALKRRAPGVEVLVGGGVSCRVDLLAARDAGADAALVASALHDGRITAHDLAMFMTGPAC